MELLQLKYFCALAQSEHLGKTASKLMISPPSLSATISKLEKELGVRLFDRSGRGIQLNRFGKIFYAYSSQALSLLDNGQKELRAQSGERYVIHVGISSLPIWQTALERFQEEHPNIEIDYYFLSPFELRNEGNKFDFFLGVSRDIPSDLYNIQRVRAPESPVVVVSSRHPLAKAESIQLIQLKDETFLTMGSNNPSAHKYIQDMCSAAGFTATKLLVVDYFFRLKMLLDNRGVAITTDLGAQSIYADPSLISIVPIESPFITRTQSIAWRNNAYLSEGALIFRDFLFDFFKDAR